jgi:membrane associated rhomboid family serine protease
MVGGFVAPGRGLKAVMITLFAIWLLFAVALNWGDASIELFLLFCGSTDKILQGEIWRLATASLMHAPTGSISHILVALIGLFFLAPTLEERWGTPRFLRFLFFSGIIAYSVQVAGEVLLPASVAAKLGGALTGPDGSTYWFGAYPVVHAIAVAFALQFQGRTVRLFFVWPVSSRGLILFVLAMSVLRVIATSQALDGLISPFGGMFAGWLLGGGTPSPLRRAYLKLRLAQLDREALGTKKRRSARVKKSPFRVIEGGRSQGDDDEPRGPDGQLLN